MALIAIVHRNGKDIQSFDTEEDGVMFVLALSLEERHKIFEVAARQHERARDNPGTTNSLMHVFASAKLNTADADSEFRRRQYAARDHLKNRKNFRAYMLEVIRDPTGKDARTDTLLVPSSMLIMPP